MAARRRPRQNTVKLRIAAPRAARACAWGAGDSVQDNDSALASLVSARQAANCVGAPPPCPNVTAQPCAGRMACGAACGAAAAAPGSPAAAAACTLSGAAGVRAGAAAGAGAGAASAAGPGAGACALASAPPSASVKSCACARPAHGRQPPRFSRLRPASGGCALHA